MIPNGYISARELAKRAALCRKTVARICKEAMQEGKLWHGRKLDLLLVPGGRGGRAGATYAIRETSLPDHLQVSKNIRPHVPSARSEKVLGSQKPGDILKRRDRRAAVVASRFRAIAHALDAEPGSEERGLRVAASAVHEDVSAATIYRWIAAYEAQGLPGLAPAVRPARPSQVSVSKRFDAGFRLRNDDPEPKLAALRSEVTRLIRAFWASYASRAGMNSMALEIATLVEDYCRAAGYDIEGLDCTVSITRIKEQRQYSIIRTYLYDARRKLSILPRIKRSYDDVAPMELLFVDVKYADMFLEEEGRRIRPALISFLDAGTGRVFTHLVQTGRSKGVTKADVRTALALLLMHRDWGLPKAIYTDNGKEMIGLIDAVAELAELGEACPIINALPYNPQAKPIEGVFSNFNRILFTKFQSFTGGAPRVLKRHETQKGPPLYEGDWETFCEHFNVLNEDYHARKRVRALSPEERFRDKMKRMNVKLDVLTLAQVTSLLGDKAVRVIEQGMFVYQGGFYSHDSLIPRHEQKAQLVLTPGSPKEPHLLDSDGELHQLAVDTFYSPLEDAFEPQKSAGAIESRRRQDKLRDYAVRLAQDVDGLRIPDAVYLAAARNFKRLRESARPVCATTYDAGEKNEVDEARARRRAVEALASMEDEEALRAAF